MAFAQTNHRSVRADEFFPHSAPASIGRFSATVLLLAVRWLILNIFLDNISRIPFTIQRLCELLMDPKRNYTGTDKFLRGLEKVSVKVHTH